jgi:ribonuclease HI
MNIELVIDGGSKGNGTANKGYGSVALLVDGVKKPMKFTLNGKEQTYEIIRVDWPNSTNNEAELKTCILAMHYADEVEQRTKKPLDWTFLTDSQLVANLHLNGMPKKIEAMHLLPLYTQILDWLDIHPGSQIRKIARAEIVKILGH